MMTDSARCLAGGLIRVPLYWLLMFPLDLGIKGYAIGFAIANVRMDDTFSCSSCIYTAVC